MTFKQEDFLAIADLLRQRDKLRVDAEQQRNRVAISQSKLKEQTDAIAEIQRRLLHWGYTGS